MSRNIFDYCSTVQEIHEEFEMLMSPENLSCDGELSRTEQNRRAADFKRQYKAKLASLK